MTEKTKKRMTIWGSLVLVITSAITAIFTPQVVMWIMVVLGADVLAVLLTWTVTEAYKRLKVATDWITDPVTDRSRPKLTIEQRKRVYWFAIKCGVAAAELAGVVLILLCMFLWEMVNFQDARFWATITVMTVLWQLNVVVTGFSAPHLWVWTFDHLLPKLNRRVDKE